MEESGAPNSYRFLHNFSPVGRGDSFKEESPTSFTDEEENIAYQIATRFFISAGVSGSQQGFKSIGNLTC